MNGKNKYLEVGIFVMAGIGLLVMLTLMFAGGRTTESTKEYSLLFQRDISGLSVGAPVRYLGVDVGQVTKMQLNIQNGTNVQVDLEVLESTPINTATFASLSFQGVTGVAFVSLAEDSELAVAQLTAPEGFKYPLIPTRDIGLSALLSSGPEITGRLVQFLDKANLVLDEKNLIALSNSLANIESLTATLSAQESTIAKLPDQLKGILNDVEKTAKQLQDTIAKGEPDLLAAMKNLDEATQSFKKVTTRLDEWTIKHEANIDAFMSGGLAQTPELISDTRVAVRELEKLLADFRKDPSQLIYKPQSSPVVVDN